MSEWFTTPALTAMLLIFIGSFVQTAIGFGLAIVAAPLLFMISPDYVPAPICLVALFISVLNAMKHRANVSIGGLKMALIGRIPGSIAGGVLLVMVSTDVLALWLGILVLFAVVVSMLPFRIEPTRREWVWLAFSLAFLEPVQLSVGRQWRCCFSIKRPISCAETYRRFSCSVLLSR